MPVSWEMVGNYHLTVKRREDLEEKREDEPNVMGFELRGENINVDLDCEVQSAEVQIWVDPEGEANTIWIEARGKDGEEAKITLSGEMATLLVKVIEIDLKRLRDEGSKLLASS